MAKRDRKNAMANENNATEVEPDDENEEQPNVATEADTDDDEYEFDMSLMPEGVKLVDLQPDFVRPEGFLMVPRVNKKTGAVEPQTTTFAGILHDIVPWIDNRGKERVWFSCSAAADLTDTFYTGKDEQNKTFVKPVKKGERIGISGSGAINALKTKKGHFVFLHWTGNKVQVKNGAMWEIKAKVSEKPLPTPAPF